MSQVLPLPNPAGGKGGACAGDLPRHMEGKSFGQQMDTNGSLAIISSKFIQLVNILFRKMANHLTSQDLR